MGGSGNQVSVTIAGGPSVQVAWQAGMNAQNALELAWNQINNSTSFTYGLQYYGSADGYLLFMVNETYDSFLSSAAPYYYWEFFVNGVSQNQGIDSTILNPGDAVSFGFSQYSLEQHAGTTLEAKAKFQGKRLVAAR